MRAALDPDRALADSLSRYCKRIHLADCCDPLLELIGDRNIVLLGASTHGTYEFYAARSEITRRLIKDRGFSAVVIEGDWPDALEIDRFISGRSPRLGNDAVASMRHFRHFPMWIWRNSCFVNTIQWLWAFNRLLPAKRRVRIFGLDLYSLFRSINEVIRFLETIDPSAADRARQLYSCFDHNHQDPVRYGRHVRIGAHPSCEEAALQATVSLFKRRFEQLSDSDLSDQDEFFFAEENARLVCNAENYYRNLFSPQIDTWNVRDRHMADTVDRILDHFKATGRPAKIIVWAHNAHVGDGRATEPGWLGQFNMGQMIRERHEDTTFSLGFTTFEGTLTVASEWDKPPELKIIPPALPDSFEALFHRTELDSFLLPLCCPDVAAILRETRLERSIGVIYSSQTERLSHYFRARISDQFNALIHFDRTSEVEPIDRLAAPQAAMPSELKL